MLNIIRADLYRIFRSKGIYVTIGLYIAMVVLIVASGNAGAIGIQIEGFEVAAKEFVLTGKYAPFFLMGSADNILYFFLPIIIFVSATDFSTKTIKNVLAGGVSRGEFYGAKFVLICLLCTCVASLNIIVPIIVGTILNGFGGNLDGEFIVSVLKPFAFQLLLILAVVCVGTFFVFVTKKTAAVIGIYIAFCWVPMLLIVILRQFSDGITKLLNYELITSIRAFGSYSALTTSDLTRMLWLGGFYILASVIGGIVIFRKSEIK